MNRLARAGVFVGFLALFFVPIYFDAFAHVRGAVTDRLYGGARALQDVLIVRIDDASIAALGRWPWPRDVEARLLRKVADARVIGMDVSFLEPSDNDALLAATLESMPHVVLAAELGDGGVHAPIFPSSYGVVNLLGDSDGGTRRFDASRSPIPFAFVMAKKLGVTPPVATGPTLINFVGPPGTFLSVSAKDVLMSDVRYGGKIVLIGATAPDLHDEYFVPMSNGRAMSGVEIHATILQNAILHTFLRAQGPLGVAALVLVVGALGMFVLPRLRILYVVPLIPALLVLYVLGAVILFEHHKFVVDVFFTPMALLTFAGAGLGMHYVDEKRKGMYLRQAFSKYVSKELLGELLAHKQQLVLGGEKRVVTVLFSDIRDFTAISETLAPEALVLLLNEYLTAMTSLVMQRQGTVDKFIGDAIMALWNAPMDDEAHAVHACATAIDQVRAIRSMKPRWAELGVPAVEVGIGINTGPAVVGNMGSGERFDYTAIGDTVNLASRIEDLTKLYGVSVIISGHTYAMVKDRFLCCRLDRVRVKGKQDPIVLYRLCVDEDAAFVTAFESALEQYFKGAFADALVAFEAAGSMGVDRPCALFIARCRAYLAVPPPPSWDGTD